MPAGPKFQGTGTPVAKPLIQKSMPTPGHGPTTAVPKAPRVSLEGRESIAEVNDMRFRAPSGPRAVPVRPTSRPRASMPRPSSRGPPPIASAPGQRTRTPRDLIGTDSAAAGSGAAGSGSAGSGAAAAELPPMRGSVSMASGSVGGAEAAGDWSPPELPSGDWRSGQAGSMDGAAAGSMPEAAGPAASMRPDGTPPPPPPPEAAPAISMRPPMPERRHPDDTTFFNRQWADDLADPNNFTEQQFHWLQNNPLQINVLHNERIREQNPNARFEMQLEHPRTEDFLGVARNSVQPPDYCEHWGARGDHSGYKVRLLNVSPTMAELSYWEIADEIRSWFDRFCSKFNVILAQDPRDIDVNTGRRAHSGVCNVWMTFKYCQDAFTAFIAFHYAWSNCPILYEDQQRSMQYYWGNSTGVLFVECQYGRNDRPGRRGGRALMDDQTFVDV